jgi:hypothetical protein
MSNLPSHQQHEAKAEKQETERGKAVLQADDFMIGGENVLAPKPGGFVVGFLDVRMRDSVSRRLHVVVFVYIFSQPDSTYLARAIAILD